MEPVEQVTFWHQRLWIGNLPKATPWTTVQRWVPKTILVKMYTKTGQSQTSAICWFSSEQDFNEALESCRSQGLRCREAYRHADARADAPGSSSSSSAAGAAIPAQPKMMPRPPSCPPPAHLFVQARNNGPEVAQDLYNLLSVNRAFNTPYQTLVDLQNEAAGIQIRTCDIPPWRRQQQSQTIIAPPSVAAATPPADTSQHPAADADTSQDPAADISQHQAADAFGCC